MRTISEEEHTLLAQEINTAISIVLSEFQSMKIEEQTKSDDRPIRKLIVMLGCIAMSLSTSNQIALAQAERSHITFSKVSHEEKTSQI